jgi:hypothetical protein
MPRKGVFMEKQANTEPLVLYKYIGLTCFDNYLDGKMCFADRKNLNDLLACCKTGRHALRHVHRVSQILPRHPAPLQNIPQTLAHFQRSGLYLLAQADSIRHRL